MSVPVVQQQRRPAAPAAPGEPAEDMAARRESMWCEHKVKGEAMVSMVGRRPPSLQQRAIRGGREPMGFAAKSQVCQRAFRAASAGLSLNGGRREDTNSELNIKPTRNRTFSPGCIENQTVGREDMMIGLILFGIWGCFGKIKVKHWSQTSFH